MTVSLAFSPGRSPNLTKVDPRLVNIMANAASGLPNGYRVTVFEGYNPVGHVPDSQHHKAGRGALDLQIWDPKGNPISNKGADKSGMYKLLAQNAYGYMLDNYPELKGKLAWGGSFGTGRGSRVPDLMHFDIGGERGDLMPHLSKLGRPSGNPIAYSPTAGSAASAAADMAAGQPSRTLRKGATDASSNGAVSRLQQQLADRGYNIGKHGVDGVYGKDTATAVRNFEVDNHLPTIDAGVAGPQVLGALSNGGPPKNVPWGVPPTPQGFPSAWGEQPPLPGLGPDTARRYAMLGGSDFSAAAPWTSPSAGTGSPSPPDLGPNLDPALYNPALPDLMGGGRASADQMFAPPDSYTQARLAQPSAPTQAPWNALAGARMPLPSAPATPATSDDTSYAAWLPYSHAMGWPGAGAGQQPSGAPSPTPSLSGSGAAFGGAPVIGGNLSANAEPYFGDQLSDAIGNGVSTVWNGLGSGISSGLDAIRRGAVNAGLALPETMGISPATATPRSPSIFDRTPSAVSSPIQAPNDMTPWGPGFGQDDTFWIGGGNEHLMGSGGDTFDLPLASPRASSQQSPASIPPMGITGGGMLNHQGGLVDIPDRYNAPGYIPFPSGGKLGAYASAAPSFMPDINGNIKPDINGDFMTPGGGIIPAGYSRGLNPPISDDFAKRTTSIGIPQDEWSFSSDLNTLPARYYDTQQYFMPSRSPKDTNPTYENMWRQEELSYPRSVDSGGSLAGMTQLASAGSAWDPRSPSVNGSAPLGRLGDRLAPPAANPIDMMGSSPASAAETPMFAGKPITDTTLSGLVPFGPSGGQPSLTPSWNDTRIYGGPDYGGDPGAGYGLSSPIGLTGLPTPDLSVRPAGNPTDRARAAVQAASQGGGNGSGGSPVNPSSYGGSPGSYGFSGFSPWGTATYNAPYGQAGYSNSPFTPSANALYPGSPAYTAPNFSTGSGGPTYAYHYDPQTGQGSFIDSHGNQHNYTSY